MIHKLKICIILLLTSCNIQHEDLQNTNDTNQNLASMENHPVVFYNVENLFDTEDDRSNLGDDDFTPNGSNFWDESRYQTKLERLEHALFAINNIPPLAIGLAEIENRKVLEDLISVGRFKNRSYKIIHFESEDTRGMDCGFIYDASRFSPVVETKLIVKIEDEPRFRTRDILYIKGELNRGISIHFFVNHWSSRREGATETEYRRIAAASILRKKVDQILMDDPSANIVIMGDFNDTPNDKSLHEVLRAKGQHELKANDLVNLLIEEQSKNLGTAVHRGNWDILDQLIISQGLLRGKNGLKVKDNNAFILRIEELLYTYKNGDQKPNSSFGGNTYYGGYSDHLPVYLLVEN